MKPPKHLVLDEDVHRALKKKKRETGINVKNLGNCALRSVLERPLLVDAIGRRLVESGRLEEQEFDAIRAQAAQEVCVAAENVATIVHPTDHDTLATGSWEIKEIYRARTGSYQILHAWVKDHRMRPMALHKHQGVEFFVILTGAVVITIDVESQIVTAPEAVTIPEHAVHSVTPLERETRMVCVISPPEPGYVVESTASL